MLTYLVSITVIRFTNRLTRLNMTTIQPISDVISLSFVNTSLGNETCVIPDRIKGTGLIFLTIFGSIVGAISLTGNLIIIIVFVKFKKLQKPGNVFLTNLAVGDLLYGIIGFPMYVSTDFVPDLFCHFFFSPFRQFILILLILVSLNNIAAIACDRFIGIRFPFFYQSHMTLRTAFVAVLFCWVFGILRSAIFAVSTSTNKVAVISEVIILSILLLLTSVVYRQLYTTSMRHLNRDKMYGIKNQESKAQVAVVIAGINAASWVPVILVRFVDSVIEPTGYWLQLTFMSPFTGSCLNLLVYTYRLGEYRRAVKKLLGLNNAVAPEAWNNFNSTRITYIRDSQEAAGACAKTIRKE